MFKCSTKGRLPAYSVAAASLDNIKDCLYLKSTVNILV